MKFLALEQVPECAPDLQCQHSCAVDLLVGLMAAPLGVAAVLVATGPIPSGFVPRGVFWVPAAFAALFAASSLYSCRSSLRPLNWLCRAQGNTLWIKCSRFWSDRPPAEMVVIELDRLEIAWIQPLKVVDDPGADSPQPNYAGKVSRQVKVLTYLDVGLGAPAAAQLEAYAQNERVPKSQRLLVAPPDFILNAPAQRIRGGILRLSWSHAWPMKPGLKQTLSRNAE